MEPSGLSDAIRIWQFAVGRVKGERVVREALAKDDVKSWGYVLAIGKAASSMMLGAREFLAADGSALVITKYDHADARIKQDSRIQIIEAGHPIPDGNSLLAGERVKALIESIPKQGELLILVSGGASALVEGVVAGMDLEKLRRLSGKLLAEGFSIDQINIMRIGISTIKGGKLMRRFGGRRIQVYGLSDIPGDDADLIGSGIAAIQPPAVAPFEIPDEIRALMCVPSNQPESVNFSYQCTLVGSNLIARQAAVEAAQGLGLRVVESEEILSGDVLDMANVLAERIKNGPSGVYIWGGEPTVILPAKPGYGGRNQSLGVALALRLVESKVEFSGVVAGSDGTDGPTHGAGALIHNNMSLDGARQALDNADAGTWLTERGGLFVTGPTGTNVMDLSIIVKS